MPSDMARVSWNTLLVRVLLHTACLTTDNMVICLTAHDQFPLSV
jgi:hypothetical protein